MNRPTIGVYHFGAVGAGNRLGRQESRVPVSRKAVMTMVDPSREDVYRLEEMLEIEALLDQVEGKTTEICSYLDAVVSKLDELPK